MILEVAVLHIKPELSDSFESTFKKASKIIASMEGYIEHQLQKCLEQANKYILLVRWETLEAHEIGFRGSEQYQEWKSLLHHYYSPFPVVEHYREISLND
ncbi:antibiotic biosynthesis monooxygenase family protein [Paenibacillus endoradicis]|uniref:antibiotic biosynthesis monooxygenase family protein n=1 Tax=Paenibacillus endoradicis TaxID=2972487 RepID=UPI0021592C96|nr:antibiotic biosynthesis monooxygenase [Paenibacillus endoradicis]MCR8656644.1 antibiotic biosynthesis monooxygenase [Paenibacillus endoradicis]